MLKDKVESDEEGVGVVHVDKRKHSRQKGQQEESLRSKTESWPILPGKGVEGYYEGQRKDLH